MQSSPSPARINFGNRYDDPFMVVNSNLKDLLYKLCPKVDISIDIPLFQMYKFNNLPFDINGKNESTNSDLGESLQNQTSEVDDN